jgi:hypothetical protein
VGPGGIGESSRRAPSGAGILRDGRRNKLRMSRASTSLLISWWVLLRMESPLSRYYGWCAENGYVCGGLSKLWKVSNEGDGCRIHAALCGKYRAWRMQGTPITMRLACMIQGCLQNVRLALSLNGVLPNVWICLSLDISVRLYNWCYLVRFAKISLVVYGRCSNYLYPASQDPSINVCVAQVILSSL